MPAPDTSNAFTAEAAADKDREIERLRGELATATGGEVINPDGTLVTDDTSLETPPPTVSVHGTDWAYRAPTPGQMMLFSIANARRASGMRRINAMYDFLDAILTEESYNQLTDRVNDSDDTFDADQMMDVITAVITETEKTPAHNAPRNGPAVK